MTERFNSSGRVQKAPENFLTPAGVKTVFAEGKQGRRDFIRRAFAAASTATAAGVAAVAAPANAWAQGNPIPTEGGDLSLIHI